MQGAGRPMSAFVAGSAASLLLRPPLPRSHAASTCQRPRGLRPRQRAHSTLSASDTSSRLQILPVPILSDNYSYLLIDRGSGVAAVVDPAQPQKMVRAAQSENVRISTVLTTHHHWDHAGGNIEISKMLPGITIYGPNTEDCEGVTDRVGDGDEIVIADSDVRLQLLSTPCHTRGHVVYYCPEAQCVFCGDTLFVAGSGRFFEGDAKDMLYSLRKLSQLSPETKVYCGHEYTVSNLRFAHSIEPDNEACNQKLAWSLKRRDEGLPTVPSTIGEELKYNPFMRTEVEAVKDAVKESDPTKVMAELRKRKNSFKG